MADFFDFARGAPAPGRRLRDPGPRPRVQRARPSAGSDRIPGCIDVTDYPEVSDLYLAADAAIVDYSSLRFDFGVTGKPMIFHVPDLQRYQDTRGWLFDFELTAPGPLGRHDRGGGRPPRSTSTTSATEYAAAYETFRAGLPRPRGRARGRALRRCCLRAPGRRG